MTWASFTNYLQEKILQKREDTTQNEYELTDWAKSKYSTSFPQVWEDLALELELLLLSYENRFDSEDNYHKLPEMEEEEEESEGESEGEEEEFSSYSPSSNKTKLKTWKELFPVRESCLLGRASHSEPPSEAVYLMLGRIYEDWRSRDEKAKDLEKRHETLEKKGEMLMKEWVSSQARKFLEEKDPNFIKEVKQWLTDYENSTQQRQAELESKAVKIKEMLAFVETEGNSSQEAKGLKRWFKSLDWKTIAISAALGLILTIIVVWFLNWIRGK